jgi:hypothetical protein
MKRKIDENKIYLIKDGFISVWEFMEQTGTIDRMKQNGITINPTHSFELLKKTRLEIFEKVKQNFIEERKIKKLSTFDFEIGCLYHSWLKREFEIIKNWLLDKPSNSDQLEISKYNNFLYMEMIQTESEINQQPKQTETNKPPRAPELGFFCSLINKIGIDKKYETESATVYCQRICNKFNLTYRDRVRQNYNENETKTLVKDLSEKVLPLIDNETKISIQKYLDNKQPPKQNLYG